MNRHWHSLTLFGQDMVTTLYARQLPTFGAQSPDDVLAVHWMIYQKRSNDAGRGEELAQILRQGKKLLCLSSCDRVIALRVYTMSLLPLFLFLACA